MRTDGACAGKAEEANRRVMGMKNGMWEVILQEEEPEGAYYCPYSSFVDYCHLMVRSKRRNDFSIILMFLTLGQGEKEDAAGAFEIQEQMQILKEALRDSLRAEDAYTQYGERHFILMLAKARKENCSLIFRRVEEAYVKRSGSGELWYYADLTQELGNVEE